jgi:hypothetical protein
MRISLLAALAGLFVAARVHALPQDIKAYCNELMAKTPGSTPDMVTACIDSEEASKSRLEKRPPVDDLMRAACAAFDSSWELTEKCYREEARERRVRARRQGAGAAPTTDAASQPAAK